MIPGIDLLLIGSWPVIVSMVPVMLILRKHGVDN